MDAVEFVKARRRMFRAGFTPECKLFNLNNAPEDIVAEVETWAKENPAKTRQSVFLEQYPEAMMYGNGVLGICPNEVSNFRRGSGNECIDGIRFCEDCRREFWLQEVER